MDKKHKPKVLLLRLLKINNHSSIEIARILLQVLQDKDINNSYYNWFVLDNTSNNDTILAKLANLLLWNLSKKR